MPIERNTAALLPRPDASARARDVPPELPPLFAGTQFTISVHFPPVHDFGTDLIGASHWEFVGCDFVRGSRMNTDSRRCICGPAAAPPFFFVNSRWRRFSSCYLMSLR